MRAGAPQVDDEVRVFFGDLRSADPAPLEAAGIEQAAGGVARRILESAPQAPLLDRLRLAPVLLHLLDALADARRIALPCLERRGANDPSRLFRFQDRGAVAEAAFCGRHRLHAALPIDGAGADQPVL